MTIYIIQWLGNRHNGDPENKVFTDHFKAQAFAMQLLRDLHVTNDELADCELWGASIWESSHWWLYTSARREQNVYVSFETKTINLPQE